MADKEKKTHSSSEERGVKEEDCMGKAVATHLEV